jgi:ABC-type thiamine transport system ATPase subunit
MPKVILNEGWDQLRKHTGRRQVALLRDLEKDGPVLLLPEEFAPVRMEPERLVELKIKRGERHIHTSAVDQMLPLRL